MYSLFYRSALFFSPFNTLIGLSILILFVQKMLSFVYQTRDFARLNSYYIKDR